MPQPQPVQPAAAADQIAALLQALQQRQIPPLPGPAPQPVAVTQPAAPQADALGLLRMMLTNPQLQQALQPPRPAVAAVSRTVQLPVPTGTAPGQTRSVPIPLGAVLNAIVALAGQSMTELSEDASEQEPEVPEYLVGDDGDFLVDPASADDRAALVAHLFRLNDAARRSGWYELDESEEWARAAGFA